MITAHQRATELIANLPWNAMDSPEALSLIRIAIFEAEDTMRKKTLREAIGICMARAESYETDDDRDVGLLISYEEAEGCADAIADLLDPKVENG